MAVRKIDREKALQKIREEKFQQATKFLDPEKHMNLIAELSTLSDLISNYQDKLIQELAKEVKA